MSSRFFELQNELRRPSQVPCQLRLFPDLRDDVLAKARVSIDEVARWQLLGWVSYDVTALETLEDYQTAEIVFIRDIARSGMTDALITEMLGELPKPYAYPPSTTAYNFSCGWVEVVFPDMDEMMDQHLEGWVQTKLLAGDEARLAEASAHLMLALAELRAKKKPDR